MEFKRNELLNEVLVRSYETFSLTLDTKDYVPDKFNKKILKYIYKTMKKSIKQAEKEYKNYIKEIKRNERDKLNTLKIKKSNFFSRLFHKKNINKNLTNSIPDETNAKNP